MRSTKTRLQKVSGRAQDLGLRMLLPSLHRGKERPKKHRTKRRGLFRDLAVATDGSVQSRDFKKCERLLAALEKTNSKEGGKAPKTGLWSRYLNLARDAAKLQNVERAVWGTRKALEMLGFEIIEGNTCK